MTSLRRIFLWTILIIPPVLLSWLTSWARRPAPPVKVDDIVDSGGRFVHRQDGRLLEYYVCGNPNGTVLYAQHGYGTTGKIYVAPYFCEIAMKLDLRIISITLPGYGLSDSLLSDANVLQEWPEDANAVLLQEGLSEKDSFYVTAASMGCVYAAAVMSATNSSRILGASFFTPMAPDSAETGLDVPPIQQFMKRLLGIPFIGDAMAYYFCYRTSVEERLKTMPDISAALTKMKGGKYDAVQRHFVDDIERACLHTHHGMRSHLKTSTNDWPFDLAKVGAAAGTSMILVTSAPDDTTNPPAMQTWFANRIPGAKIQVMEPGWGHLHCILPEVIESVWREMIQDEDV